MGGGGGRRREPTTALALADIVERATPVGGRAAWELRLAASWSALVGPAIARRSRPLSVRLARRRPTTDDDGDASRGGTLTVLVDSAFALEMQHLAPVILDRVAGLLGPGAVTKLAIRQGTVNPISPPAAATVAPPPAPAPAGSPVPVEDEELRASLERLRQALRAKPARDA